MMEVCVLLFLPFVHTDALQGNFPSITLAQIYVSETPRPAAFSVRLLDVLQVERCWKFLDAESDLCRQSSQHSCRDCSVAYDYF